MTQKDKRRIYVGTTVMGLLALGIIYFSLFSISGRESARAWAMISISIAILLLAIFFMLRRLRTIKQGFPLEDELSSNVKLKAESRAFRFSLNWLLVIMWYNFFAEYFGWYLLNAGDVIAIAIIGMLASFMSLWLYYNRRGL